MSGRVRPRRNAGTLAAALCAGLAVSLTACGGGGGEDPDKGTNGVGELPADRIEKKARKAARGAVSVRLSGTVVSKGQTYRLEMRLKESGGIGDVSAQGGDTFQLLRVEKDLYLKADADFWVHREKSDEGEASKADLDAAAKLDGKYVKVPQDDPAYEQLSGFTEMKMLLDGLLVMNGDREKGDRGEVRGTRTVQVRAGDGRGGTLAVSLDGKPYPVRLKRGGGAGTVLFDDWNKGFALRAPKDEQVVDYGKKISGGD